MAVCNWRYERASTVIKTNKPYKYWPSVFNNDATLTSAVLDRILHHAATVVIEGSSYRMKDRVVTVKKLVRRDEPGVFCAPHFPIVRKTTFSHRHSHIEPVIHSKNAMNGASHVITYSCYIFHSRGKSAISYR